MRPPYCCPVWTRLLRAAFAASLPVVAGVVALPLAAQTLTEQQLIDALTGKTSRGIAPPGPATSAPRPASSGADDARLRELIELLDKSRTRAFTAKERVELAQRLESSPTVDTEIYFEFNSADISPDSKAQLENLARALKSSEMRNRAVLIAGHTDAKGKAEVNRIMSQRRAEAVKQHLVRLHQVEAGRIKVIGYGEERLKVPKEPFSPVNRRVQIVALPENAVAARR